MASHDKSSSNGAPAPTKVLGREERPLRKRFFTGACACPAAGGFKIQLDGRDLRTPGKHALVVSHLSLAEIIAAEWNAQGEVILPETMPMTSLAFTAIDAVASAMPAVAEEIASYGGSDLTCYRADGPVELIAQQAAAWDPVLAWAASEFGVRPRTTTGVMPIAQPPGLQGALLQALTPLDPLSLTAAHVLTTLMGSALLALAVLRGRLTLEDAWHRAHIDEDWEIARWGHDAEADARRALRHRTAVAAGQVLACREAT